MSKAAITNEAQVEVPPVIDDAAAKKKAAAVKAAATRKANKEKKAAEAALAAATPAMDVSQTAASVMSPAAPVEVAPVAAEGIDRKSYTDAATKMLEEMQALGVPDDQIGVKVQECFSSVGVAPTRLSLLDDASLPVVVQAIHNCVEGLKTNGTAAAPSYI